MEKDRYNDPLDDYVRKSFEDYEEDPSSDMWDRVERELEPADSPRRAFWLFRWPTGMAMIGLLLLGGLLGGHFSMPSEGVTQSHPLTPGDPLISDGVTQSHPLTPVEGKRSAPTTGQSLQSEGVTSSHPLTPAEVKRSALTTGQPLQSEGVTSSHPLTPVEGKRSVRTTGRPLQSDGVTQSHPVTPSGPSSAGTASNRTSTSPMQPVPSPTLPITTPGQSNNHLTATNTYSAESPILSNDSLNNSDLPPSQPPIAELKPLDPRIFQLEAPQQHPLLPPAPPIQPTPTPSGWYIGLHLTPNSTFEKNTAAATGRPRLNFVSEPENPDFSMDAWLKVGKKIRSRFGLESGLGYHKASVGATHTAVLYLRDGIPVTSTSRVRDFRYTVDTYSGSAAVSLRMEQVDNAPVSLTELLRIKITTTEQVQMLRVPLLAVFRVGTGRLQGMVKAGVTGNFFLRNQLDISTRTSQTSRFRPSPDSDGYSVQLEQPKRFFAGYWVSGGLEWSLSRRISLVAEPCFSGNFVRKDGTGRRLPDQVSVGGSLGVNYEL